MKTAKNILFVCLLLIIGFNSCSVKYKNFVFVSRDDGSPYYFRIKHLWTEKKNPIYADPNLIKIWTDNGIITPDSVYLENYNIIPTKNGTVNIYTLSTVKNKSGNLDTITSKTTFKAIRQPEIITVFNEKLLKDSSLIDYGFVFKRTLKPIKGRYKWGVFPLEIRVFNDDNFVGEIFIFTTEDEMKDIINKGNKILVPSFGIRDMKTDLLIWTDKIEYKY